MEINWKPVEPPVYQRGDLYETHSVECGYTELYRWINMNISTDWICDGTTKYYKQKEQVSYDEGQTWQDVIPYEYQRGSVYETQSTDCGYVPPTPQYRWVNMDISTDWVCYGTTKYYKQKKQVSYDEGQTWQDVIPYEYQTGSIYETQSTDCGYVPPIYRWVNMDISTDYICDETTYVKYYKQKKQISFDGGQTWTDVTPAEYQRGDVYETESFDCGFIPYLTFEAIDDCTFNFYKLSMESFSSPLYSIDMGEWKGKWDSPEHDWVTVRAGQTIRWKWKPRFNSSDYYMHKIGYFASTGRFNAKGYVSSMLYGEECLEKNGDEYNWWYVYTQLFKGNTGLTSAADVVLPTYTYNGYFISMFEGCTSLISAPVIPATVLRGYEYNAMFSGCTNLNAITYLSSRANSTHNYNWLYGVAPSGTFYKKSYLTNYDIGPSGIPEGWTIVDA